MNDAPQLPGIAPEKKTGPVDGAAGAVPVLGSGLFGSRLGEPWHG